MARTNDSINCLKRLPRDSHAIDGSVMQDGIGPEEERAWECHPRPDPKCSERNAGKDDCSYCGTDEGAPLPTCNQRDRDKNPELRLVGKIAEEHPGKHRSAFECHQRCAKQRRSDEPGLPPANIERAKRRCQEQGNSRWLSNDQIDDASNVAD